MVQIWHNSTVIFLLGKIGIVCVELLGGFHRFLLVLL